MSEESEKRIISEFDRVLGSLHGLPDVTHTSQSTVQHVPFTARTTGGTETYIIQTYRQKDQGDTIFLQRISDEGTVRIPIPPKVAAVINRQRDQIGVKVRSKAAKAVAQSNKEKGILPGFMRKAT